MLREFIVEYKDGIVASLQGFLVLHKLDRPESSQTAETKNPAKTAIFKQTVLENRRRKNLEKNALTSAQKEVRKKVTTLQRVFMCAAINIVSVLVVLLLTYLINLLKYSFLSAFIKYFGSLLLLPIFLTVRLLSTLWFADIASSALKYRGLSSSKIPDLSRAASDFIHAIFVELVFLTQALAIIGLDVPFLSSFFGFIYMSLLHSLYSFDYYWMSSGISMNTRLAMIERRWPFHLGFGTLLTAATSVSENFVINGCIFGALFPFFIVSSFLTDIPDSKRTSDAVPPVHFYYLAQTLTNKISVAIFSRHIC
ncbi:etoposide-induced protein 2.4 (EI24) domain-containing protein [Ditylenchus destructor]|uniref:Etoposide-induced protein 2.4 (EI24) domain-containing protein n=1 Tax=Ditylenchus destructor TaxID=166010 RepID=A0AAD4ND52_9BILA|nr:etoposide-induced protein 2.4 (EI24) domain-containing protein [Ditylenchus destructor]